MIGITRLDILDRFNPSRASKKQVAVLPFRNIGGDPGQQAFIDGLAETLTLALMRQPGLVGNRAVRFDEV